MKKRVIKIGLWLGFIILLLVVIPLGCCQMIITLTTSEISKSENPPATLQESDLVGTWKADYGRYHGVDMLILRADGTFKQVYENQREDYVYETPWNKWWLERFPDGRVRLHLKGARYFLDGIRWAEKEGLISTFPQTAWPYHDPFDPRRRYRSVKMVGELILNVRVLPSGELVLDHMWPSSEWGFGDADLFHHVETPISLETPAP